MNACFVVGASAGQSVVSSGLDHMARSPFAGSLMSGTHIEGLLAAGLVLVFMTVALLKPEWMG